MFALAPTPHANSFVDTPNIIQPVYPLEIFRCQQCGHIQLLDIVDPGSMFRHYVYLSGTSPVMVDHLNRYADEIERFVGLRKGDFVLEFGSNDGTLLGCFQQSGMKVLGIDPAENIAEIARANGVDTLAEFFTIELARSVRDKHGSARVICANNVCAHIDDLAAVFDGVRDLLAPDGVFVFEVGYLYDVITKTYFDTIYHEHVDFHHIGPLIPFCKTRGLDLIGAQRVTTQGGSIRCFVQLAGGPRQRDASLEQLLALEDAAGLNRTETYRAFYARVKQRGVELVSLLEGLKHRGFRLAAFGAPAKATTLMYQFNINGDLIDYIVDDNSLKQGTFTPGLHVPVVGPDSLIDRRPDYLLILAWNFAQSIIARNTAYAQTNGRFIVPLPDLKIY
jgi:SAM-dependent methyltransferase